MSQMQCDKGQRIEREVVDLHRQLGLRAERMPLSGAARCQGNGADVDVCAFGPDEAAVVCEVKARAYGGGLGSARHTAAW